MTENREPMPQIQASGVRHLAVGPWLPVTGFWQPQSALPYFQVFICYLTSEACLMMNIY
jgi:hypothetical protein